MSAAGRASASEYVSSPTERSVGSFFVPRVARATTLGRSVACKTFQSYRIGFEWKPFLLRGSVENGNNKLLKIEVLKIALLKIAVWVLVLDWATRNEK